MLPSGLRWRAIGAEVCTEFFICGAVSHFPCFSASIARCVRGITGAVSKVSFKADSSSWSQILLICPVGLNPRRIFDDVVNGSHVPTKKPDHLKFSADTVLLGVIVDDNDHLLRPPLTSMRGVGDPRGADGTQVLCSAAHKAAASGRGRGGRLVWCRWVRRTRTVRNWRASSKVTLVNVTSEMSWARFSAATLAEVENPVCQCNQWLRELRCRWLPSAAVSRWRCRR